MRAVLTAATRPAAVVPAQREPQPRRRDDEPAHTTCPACGKAHAHDFGRITVRERVPRQPQAAARVGAADDLFEREADAVADRVMRMPDGAAPPPCAVCARDDSTIRRQTESPYSVDDGVVTPAIGDDAAETVQSKAAAGGPAAPTPAAARAIAAVRGGSPLPAGVRAFMETRFGHDFGRVRIHTDGSAEAAARSLHARAYTLGRDVVFGVGQFAADSTAGRRLIAHELAHVIQQGQAPRSARGGPDESAVITDTATLVQRVQWSPNTATGKTSEPWGSGRPKGQLLDAKTDAGTTITTWRPDDGRTYWCHGYTFGGSTAKGGPYSVFGDTVPTILTDDGWQQSYSCMTRPGDILVFSDAADRTQHTGIVRRMVATAGQVDEAQSTLESKWGMAALNTSSWETNVKQYGRYRCYSKAPLTGACSPGANEK